MDTVIANQVKLPVVRVNNIISKRSGRRIANQFEIVTDDGTYFQSYNTLIVAIVAGRTYLDPDWDYSRTTSRYRAIFLGETTKETKRKIKDGVYVVRDLNG
jgi:hypothetical protein